MRASLSVTILGAILNNFHKYIELMAINDMLVKKGKDKSLAATLLIAEDDIGIRQPMAEFLRDFGYNVVEACNADEAVAVLESGIAIDLLFSDVKMPGSMDGRALAHRIRDEWPDTDILLTSGYASEAAEGEAPGRFLPKPYRPLSLLSTILAIVEP